MTPNCGSFMSHLDKVFLYITQFDLFLIATTTVGVRGGVVVKALRYKPAGRGFDSRWCHWNFPAI